MSTYIKGFVYHIRLMNGDQILARLYDETDKEFIVEYPFQVSENRMDGMPSIFLYKYLQFSKETQTSFLKDKIISISESSVIFEEYYYKSVEYNITIIEPNVEKCLLETIDQIQIALDQSKNKEFSKAVKNHNINLKAFNNAIKH